MNANDIDRLLLDSLDGTASAEARALAEVWLAGHPEARARRIQLEALFAELASVSPAAPPSDLRERVIEQIRSRGAAVQPAGGAPAPASAARFGAFTRRPLPAAGLAFAAGIAVGALAIGGLRDAPRLSGRDPAQVSGAMGVADHAGDSPATVTAGAARVIAHARLEAGVCRVMVDLDLPAGFTAELSDPAGLRTPRAIRRASPTAVPARIEDARVVWSEPGSGAYDLEWTSPRGATGPLRMSLISPTESLNVELPVITLTRR